MEIFSPVAKAFRRPVKVFEHCTLLFCCQIIDALAEGSLSPVDRVKEGMLCIARWELRGVKSDCW